MSTINRFRTKEPTSCAICRRRASCLGYAPNQFAKVMWLCDETECHMLAEKVWHMPQRTLDAYEMNAAADAGDEAGAFLDELGKTDLASLDQTEWAEFIRRVIVGFEKGMRTRLLSGTAPF